jgi:hypothetical protein
MWERQIKFAVFSRRGGVPTRGNRYLSQ